MLQASPFPVMACASSPLSHPASRLHPPAVDESMLTGESRLVPVSEGSSVTGGTLAYEAPITLRATSTGSASTLAGIGRWGAAWGVGKCAAAHAAAAAATAAGPPGKRRCSSTSEQLLSVCASRTVTHLPQSLSSSPVLPHPQRQGSTMTRALTSPALPCPIPRRLVADAQAREAPVQRLADVVAGRFCYGVMAASAATFGFWSLAGANWFPQALGEQPGGREGLPCSCRADGAVHPCSLEPDPAAFRSVSQRAPPPQTICRRCGGGGRAGSAAAEPAAGY